MFSTFSPEIVSLWECGIWYCRTGHIWQYIAALAPCMLDI